MKRTLLGIIRGVLTALAVVSGAIAAPVLFRPFFYWHIQPLNLTGAVGLTLEQVKTAYNEMMNYCIGLANEFSAGALPFSESGASHFADVRRLFVLDLSVLALSLMILLILRFFCRGAVRLGGHTPGFWSAAGLGVAFLTVGGLVAVDFNKAFEVFHRLFFPGKDNWLFDSGTDPIINMLPAVFFRNCAILILSLILLSCALLIAYDRKQRHRK